ncbi:hemerythrin domain-containing protein, partial [Kibdelosporangium lantanae]
RRARGDGRPLLTHCLSFCAHLHEHHTNEDRAFALLDPEFPELATVFERFRREHRVVAEILSALNGIIAAGGDITAEFDRLTKELDEHFAAEESYLVPALTS